MAHEPIGYHTYKQRISQNLRLEFILTSVLLPLFTFKTLMINIYF